MLYALSADQKSFKTVSFHEGLNIILADRQLPINENVPPQRRTRNGAGKSSIIDLIHFLWEEGPKVP
jgi:uncharacterized protein YydD (DUF2326 family)